MMTRPGNKRRRETAFDLEEIAPNRFLMHNVRTHAVLKGEGTITGRLFELTTWRRAGLLARLRARGFRLYTLGDRLDELPTPPSPPPILGLGWREVNGIEQISHFDLRRLRWHPLAVEDRDGVAGVTIYGGWVLRRRKGRGASSYYLAVVEHSGGIGLKPLDETTALLTGYAQAMALDARPLLVEQRDDQYILPDAELPPPYRRLIEHMTRPTDAGLLVERRDWPLVQEVFARLGVRLTATGGAS